MGSGDDTARRFVSRSTEGSIRAGAVSLLALAEIPLALILYFYLVPRWFGYWTPVLVSAFAAPLLLLRSEASVRDAVAMWRRYDKPREDGPLAYWEWALILGGAIICSGAVSWWVMETWLAPHVGWSLFWRSFLLGLLCLNIGLAIGIGVSRAGTGGGARAAMVVAVGTGIVAGAEAGVVATAGMLVAAGVAVGAALVVGAELITTEAVAVIVAVVVGGLLVWGLYLGLWLRSVLVRALSVLRALPEGFAGLVGNWHRAMLCEDVFHAPELIPGARSLGLDLRGENEAEDEESWAKSAMLLAYPLAILWRLALKSTFWLYGPVLFIAHPGSLGGRAAREEWLTRDKTAWERLLFWAALALFALAVLTLLDPGDLVALWRESKAAGVPFDLLTWSLALDWEALRSQPWRWFSLANLACALAVFLWRDALAKRLANGEALALRGWPVGALVRLARAQIAFFVGYWLLSLIYFVPFMVESGRAPGWRASR